MSFYNLNTAISSSFQRAKDAAGNPDNSTGFFKTFKNNLLSSPVTGQDYTRNTAGEIVTRENIDTYIPELKKNNANTKLNSMLMQQNLVQSGSETWDDYFDGSNPSHDYLRELIEDTKDLSDLTGDDLVKANEKARASVLSQNEALKQQSIAAKTSKMTFQALATAGGMVAEFLIAKEIELAAENIKNSHSSFSELKHRQPHGTMPCFI